MSLRSCVGPRINEPLLSAIEEAVKDSALARLHSLLAGGEATADELAYKGVLHQAAWLGHTACVRVLLDHGARPDEPHRKNGCTPLHLAHFCTVLDDTNPGPTIRSLVAAGADINGAGGRRCGKVPIDHAIQHQKIHSVQVLLTEGAQVTLQSVLISIDVANPRILELLLIHGGDCGAPLGSVVFWGQPLHRALYSPLKCPRECYKQLFRLLVQATVCYPASVPTTAAAEESSWPAVPGRTPAEVGAAIEAELRTIASEYVDLAEYLFVFLVRSGFVPTEPVRRGLVAAALGAWTDDYLSHAPSLRDLAVRTVRSSVYASGNIISSMQRLPLPSRLKNFILMINPF